MVSNIKSLKTNHTELNMPVIPARFIYLNSFNVFYSYKCCSAIITMCKASIGANADRRFIYHKRRLQHCSKVFNAFWETCSSLKMFAIHKLRMPNWKFIRFRDYSNYFGNFCFFWLIPKLPKYLSKLLALTQVW